MTVVSDRDDDTVPDAIDQCQDVQGPPRVLYSGCPYLQRRMTVDYADGVLIGTITVVQVAGVPAGACSRRSALEVVRLEGISWMDTLASGWTEADGSFAYPVGQLEHGTRYYAVADRFFDPGVGFCMTADLEQEFLDRDGDSFADAEDECPDVDGPPVGAPGFSEAFRGCRLVDLKVSASFADGFVIGQLRLTDPLNAPPGACAAAAQVRVNQLTGELDGAELDGTELGRGETSAHDGTYSIQVGDLPIGTRLRVTTYFPQVVVADVAACGPSRSAVVEITDGDGDEVPDYLDECPGTWGGQASTQRFGCPTLERRVTATYAAGVVSGDVRLVEAASAPEGVCVPADVEVYLIRPGLPATKLASRITDAEGGFDIELAEPLAARSTFQVVAAGFPDGAVADCALAASAEVEVLQPDQDLDGVADRDDLCRSVPAPSGYQGCPTVQRSVTSKYDTATAVSGRVRLANAEVAPGTCLRATVQVLRTGADGVTTPIGSTTSEPDGSYRVVLEQALVGRDVYFAIIASTVDRELAFCAGGQSGARAAPVVPAAS